MQTPEEDAVIKAKASETPGKTLIKAARAIKTAEAMIAFCGTLCLERVSALIAFRKRFGESWQSDTNDDLLNKGLS